MCLIAWNWQPQSDTPFLLVANRDEYYERPTRAMHWWEDEDILAGKDLRAGGTWLGISKSGRFAALTNFRDPKNADPNAHSRGTLVSNFLRGDTGIDEYLRELRVTSGDYNPFNLMLLDGDQFIGFESKRRRTFEIPHGIGAVSNAYFNTPWPKLVQLKVGLRKADLSERAGFGELFHLLGNTTRADVENLPKTGIPFEREHALSAAFIATTDYGTRASTIVRINKDGWSATERTFSADGLLGQVDYSS
jgi:uncharacterized protein with NRDE domain